MFFHWYYYNLFYIFLFGSTYFHETTCKNIFRFRFFHFTQSFIKLFPYIKSLKSQPKLFQVVYEYL